MRATGAEVGRRWFLAQLAAAYGQSGQAAAGLALLAEALASVPATGEHCWERSCIASRGSAADALGRRHTEAALQRAATSPVSSRPSRWSCAPP